MRIRPQPLIGCGLLTGVIFFIYFHKNTPLSGDNPNENAYMEGAYGHLQVQRSLVDESKENTQIKWRTANDIQSLLRSLRTDLTEGGIWRNEVPLRKLDQLNTLFDGKNRPHIDPVAGSPLRLKGDLTVQELLSRSPNMPVSDSIFQKMIVQIEEVCKTIEHRKSKRRKGEELSLYREKAGIELPAWKVFHNRISQYELYPEDDPTVEQLLYDLANQPIDFTEEFKRGTQLKLIFTFEDGGRALFKPGRFGRNVETPPDHFYFAVVERHTSEIAAFHLDRLLGFRRVPPTTGRIINITNDIEMVADSKLAKRIYISPANNKCLQGTCSQYCKSAFSVCGKPDLIEGSFASFLPSTDVVPTKLIKHPWKRAYSKRRRAEWEDDDRFCEGVRSKPPWDSGRMLLDLMDMAVFDFFTGNMDRHSYRMFVDFMNDTIPLHLDQGRSFDRSYKDELSALAPIYQCCLIRYSTMMRLLVFARGNPTLSEAMRVSMSKDKLFPLLNEAHLKSLDRRMRTVISTLHTCIKNLGVRKVVIDDGF